MEPDNNSYIRVILHPDQGQGLWVHTPIEVAAVGAWLVVGDRVGARPQKGTIVVATLA